jgi:hypothetical protein
MKTNGFSATFFIKSSMRRFASQASLQSYALMLLFPTYQRALFLLYIMSFGANTGKQMTEENKFSFVIALDLRYICIGH